jgi:hypothetical protein
MRYPDGPGHKGTETSRAAAEFVAPSAGRMMDRVEAYLQAAGPASPEEISAGIAQPGEILLLNSVRARCTQLRALGRVVDSGQRGKGESGKVRVIRWRVATADERSRFAALRALEAEKGPVAYG